MKRRIYFILPNASNAQEITKELLINKISDRFIRYISKNKLVKDVQEANILYKTNIIHAASRGLWIGGLSGLVLGMLIMIFPPNQVSLELVTILFTTVGGAFFGVWVSSLLGASVPNSKLQPFARDIEEGKILMIVDVPANRVNEIQEFIVKEHPEVTHMGIDPMTPVLP